MTTMTTTATDTAAPTGRRTARPLALTYAGLDLKRQLRDRMGMFFTVALPSLAFVAIKTAAATIIATAVLIATKASDGSGVRATCRPQPIVCSVAAAPATVVVAVTAPYAAIETITYIATLALP